MKPKTKKAIKQYLVIASVVYLLLFLIDKRLFLLDIVSPPYP